MKIRIYVLCYDDETELKARQGYGSFAWATIVRIESTPILENVMYARVLEERRAEWVDCDYVGTLSWKALQKIKPIEMDIIAMRLMLEKPDLVVFAASKTNLVGQAQTHHPRFKSLWIDWLGQLGYAPEVACDSSVLAFFYNYWMATPAWMTRYCAFFARAKAVLDTHAPIQDRLWSDSTYKKTISNSRCMEIYGKPYFPYHCFLYERLPCFFFWKEQADIKVAVKNLLL